MGWTKRQLIEDAFGELALAGYDFDLSPEEMQAGLRRLDTMLATWASAGVNIGYAFGLTPTDSDLDQDAGIPLQAVEAVYLNLAARIAGSKGKTMPRTTLFNAKGAYDALVSVIARGAIEEQQLDNTVPRGAGNKPYRRYFGPFVPPPDEGPLTASSDGGLTFNGN